jgi:DNA invertase Pin-like site-specific DNA recombinase
MAKAAATVWLSYERLSVARNAHELIGVIDQHQVNVAEIQRRGDQIESYRDAGGHRSGRSEAHRPDWRRVVSRLEDDDVAGIVATFQDRLSRDVEDTARLIKLCERLGKHLILPLDGVDTTRSGWTPDVKLMLHIKASVAQHYADDVAKKLRRRVVHYHQDKGIPWGRLPFGMKRLGKGYETRCVGDDRHVHTVLQVLTWYASGMSYDSVCERANAHGLMFADRAGNPKRFGRESVRTIVGNISFYLGYLQPIGWDAKNDKVRLVDGEGSFIERYLAMSGARRVTSIEPIIGYDLAETVIERRARNQQAGRKPDTHVFLLAPILHHSRTGKKMRGETKPSGDWYRTRGTGAWLKAQELERTLISRLAGVQFPPEAFVAMRAYLERKNGDAGRGQAQAALADAAERKATLVQLLLDKVIDRPVYDAKFAELEAAERAARAVLSRPTDVERVMSAISDLGSAIADMAPTIQKRNILRIFQKLVVDDEGRFIGARLSGWAHEAFEEVIAYARLGANDAEGGNQGQHWHLDDDAAWLVELLEAAGA